MLKKIKRHNLLRALPCALVLWVIAAVMLWSCNLSSYFAPAVSLEELDFNAMEGAHIKTGITYLWGDYMYEETTESSHTSVTEEAFIISAGRGSFIGMTTRGSLMKAMLVRWNDQDPYLDGAVSGDPEPIPVEGMLRRMSGEHLSFYQSMADDMVDALPGLSRESFQLYYLDTNAFGGVWWGVGIAGLLIAAGAVYLTLSAQRGQKRMRAAIQEAQEPYALTDELDRFYEETPCEKGIRLSEKWLQWESCQSTGFVPVQGIQRVYQRSVRRGLPGVNLGYKQVLTVVTAAGQNDLPLPTTGSRQLIERILAAAPGARQGAGDEETAEA